MGMMRGGKKNLIGLRDMCSFLEEHNLSMNKMVEIGTYMGESAAMFVLYFNEVHCVDPWDQDFIPGTLSATDVEIVFDRVLGKLSFEHSVYKHKMLGSEYAKNVEDESFDFVYIDGDHHYESVVEDIKNWYPKVKTGHFIGGHDYSNPNATEVEKAVNDVLGFPEKTFMDHSWLIRK